jgi:hypothetical protein
MLSRQGLHAQREAVRDVCELLGLTFNKPISPSLSFRADPTLAATRRHGQAVRLR